MKKIIECVPNFSEGRDKRVIDLIAQAISTVEGVKLLDIDPGAATNRTVFTFVGDQKNVVLGAFAGIKAASQWIDMRKHSGEHPRFGAADVCPFIPIANASMEDCIECAKELGKLVGEELQIPVYLYEYAASAEHRRNLASVRAGEYEGIEKKIALAEWVPDFGPRVFNPMSGNIAIGARDLLIAYNVNLNTTSVRRANSVAFDVREQGRIKRTGELPNSPIEKDESGNEIRIPGTCKSVKAIGWFIKEYGMAQVSMNLTKLEDTPLHKAFDECEKSAYERGMRVTGSELIGLVPLNSLLEAGRYFLTKQKRSTGVSDSELIKIAVKTMGLDELTPFDSKKKIIEYAIEAGQEKKLIDMNLHEFADETASESPAPGGGSVSAYVGAMGVGLGTMVANLSSHKPGWDDKWKIFGDLAKTGQDIMKRLMQLVDEDTAAFNKIMEAFSLPKSNEQEKETRSKAIQDATIIACEVPLEVMKEAYKAWELIEKMVEFGNPNSISDAGVGALCINACIRGAGMNVKINASSLKDKENTSRFLELSDEIESKSMSNESHILKMVYEKISSL